jgi:hypothetical protein
MPSSDPSPGIRLSSQILIRLFIFISPSLTPWVSSATSVESEHSLEINRRNIGTLSLGDHIHDHEDSVDNVMTFLLFIIGFISALFCWDIVVIGFRGRVVGKQKLRSDIDM